jgi:N-acetylmuramoyl-L-alanine amidase
MSKNNQSHREAYMLNVTSRDERALFAPADHTDRADPDENVVTGFDENATGQCNASNIPHSAKENPPAPMLPRIDLRDSNSKSNYKWLLDAGHGGLTPDGVYTTAPSKMHVFADGLTFYEGVNNRAIVDRLIPMMEKAGIEYETVYDAVLDTPLRERVAKANAIHAGERRIAHDAQARECSFPRLRENATDGQAQMDADGVSQIAQIQTRLSGQVKYNYTIRENLRAFNQRKSAGNVLSGIQEGTRCIYLSIHSDAMPDGAHGKGSGFSIYTSKGQTRSDVIGQIFCGVYADKLKQFRFREDLSDGDADMEEDFYVLRKTHCPALLVENLFFDNRREAEFLLSEEGRQTIAEALFTSIQYTEKYKPV